MKNRDELVDFPAYNPNEHVVFPPPGPDETPSVGDAKAQPSATKQDTRPYVQRYEVDPPTTDPSLTEPGMPNLRDPATRDLTDEQLAELNPNIKLHYTD